MRRAAQVRCRALTGLLLLLPVVACSGTSGDEGTLDLGGGQGSSSPEETASPEGTDGAPSVPTGVPEIVPAPEQGAPVEQEDAGVHALELPEDGPQRQAAAAFVDYFGVRLQAFNTGTVDLVALGGSARGDALTGVQSYVSGLEQDGRRTVGDVWIPIGDDEVSLTGRGAELDFCFWNSTADVDEASGAAVESPPDAYDTTAVVDRVAPGTWLVASFTAEAAAGC